MSSKLLPGQSASDNAGFDDHATDPAKMRAEVHKDLGLVAKTIRWECNDCGNEVKSSTRPTQCPKCGGRIFIALD
jgi:rubrerythrin